MMGGPNNVCKDLIEIKIVTSALLLDFIIFSLSGDELAASRELSRCAWIRATESTAWLRAERTMMAELQKLSQSRAKLSSGNTRDRPWDQKDGSG